MPTDDPLVFAADIQDPDQQYWKPEAPVALKLLLTSAEEALREEEFHVFSATLDDGTDVREHVTHDALTLNENILRYTPQAPGEHTLRLRLGLDWEPEGAQKATCRIAVPAAPWRVRGQVNETGTLNFKMDGVDASWREEQWTLLPDPAWGSGVAGTLHNSSGGDSIWGVEEEETLSFDHKYGENNGLTLNLTKSSLHDPQVRFTVQGPDAVEKEVQVDLFPLCVAKLKNDMGEVERNLVDSLPEVREHVQAVEELYVLDEETVSNPNSNREKVREVEERLTTMEKDKEAYDRDLQRLETLDQQDPEHASKQLPVLQSAQQRLEDAVKCLRSTQVQLKYRCTTAAETFNKAARSNNRYDIETLLTDPLTQVKVPHILLKEVDKKQLKEEFFLIAIANQSRNTNDVDEEGWNLLHWASYYGHIEAARLLLGKGINVNHKGGTTGPDYDIGVTPLHVAISHGNEETAQIIIEEANEIDLELNSCQGYTALHLAVSNGLIQVVKDLLNKKVDVDAPRRFTNGTTCNNVTPLFFAKEKVKWNDHEEERIKGRMMVRLLKRHGAIEPAGYCTIS